MPYGHYIGCGSDKCLFVGMDIMIGFGEKNEEFGNVPPSLIICKEIQNKEGFADNALLIQISTWTGIELQIKFPGYIMHLTRNESYTAWNDDEIRLGNYLIIFTKSRLIDAYDDLIVHTEDYSWPGKGTHYGIYTADHIIDVLANSAPIITRL